MFQPVCDGSDDCGLAVEDFDCDECVQGCEDASCTVEFTSQCTEQCVVVACTDPHHEVDPCGKIADGQDCAKQCTGELDCTVFEEFLRCCSEHHLEQADYRPYTSEAAAAAAYSFMYDPAIDSYLAGNSQAYGQQKDPLAFPPLDSATSTPQLVPSPTFELSPSPFAHTHSGNPMPSPSPSSLPSPALQSSPESFIQCKWSGCFATFSSLSELVGHVNLQHLRIPAHTATTSFGHAASYLSSQGNQHDYRQQSPADKALACLWDDCHLYPSSQSIPGPSSGDPFNVFDMLTSHLLQDHLGVSARTPSFQDSIKDALDIFQPMPQAMTQLPSPPSTETIPTGSPPTPVPEHDCSLPSSHNCKWTGCGQSFPSCNALTEHIASAHIGSGRAHYDCFWEGCARNGDHGFASKQKISRHMQSHTGHRPFPCNVCGQNFSEAATLAQHMRRHTQEKPYVCDHPSCGKAFAIAGALTIHKRTHNGSKPFKCTYCDRAFSESSNLSKHLRTHTGARPYSCTEPGCSKTFARPDQLARHMNIHKRKAAENAAAAAAVEAS
ncbi:hypothetical protein K466DRAFT_477221 [Polyporus arcularius HHB13444]|uniref:C2H2-type domain-containing protein n=1 Tax=Polyporus arcularius HHB13444 TaxID=1314778 RepID=A0A5C3Q1C3_9APHY|nr:hypothetical protein K466DRAFT_477221 [Polyporus arcularius HHB13444]